MKKDIPRLAFLAVFSAIIILQSSVPILGYIPIPPLNPTIIQVTVCVAACILGPKNGALVGLIWGLTSWGRSFSSPNLVNLYVFTNPIVSVLPRILVGLFAGYTYLLFRKIRPGSFAYVITALVGSLTNTILVLGTIYFFFGEIYAELTGISFDFIGTALITIIGTNGIGEAFFSALILPILMKALQHYEQLLNPIKKDRIS